MLCILLSVLAACCLVDTEARATTPDCTVSEWGPFTDWRTPYHDKSIRSIPSPPPAGLERESTARLSEQIQDNYNNKIQCQAEGNCMRLPPRIDEGAFTCFGNLINGKLPCSNIDQQAFVPLDYIAGQDGFGNDIWGWTDPVNGDEYVVYGTDWGTGFVRVTDPINPVNVGYLPGYEASHPSRDVKVLGNYAYVVSEANFHGVQIFDMIQLRGVEVWTEFAETAHYPGIWNCHNIVANEDSNFVYAVGCTNTDNGCDGGLHAIDVTIPTNPLFAGCFGDDGYVVDAQCVMYTGPDLDHAGKEICFSYNRDTLTIVDVTNKDPMTMISRTGYAGAFYTQQGWVTEDQTVLLLGDQQDEQMTDGIQRTYIWDITDLDAPTLENTYFSGVLSIDHNQYIVGDLVYQANYEAGLRILRLNQTAYTLTELAYFDTYPMGDNAAFNGLWSVYPFFQSGNLMLSSIEMGLYIVKPDLAGMRETEAKALTTSERSRYRSILEADDVTICPNLVETQYR